MTSPDGLDCLDRLSYLDDATAALDEALARGAHEEFENLLDRILAAIDRELGARGNAVPAANFTAALIVANATRARVNVCATRTTLLATPQRDIARAQSPQNGD